MFLKRRIPTAAKGFIKTTKNKNQLPVKKRPYQEQLSMGLIKIKGSS